MRSVSGSSGRRWENIGDPIKDGEMTIDEAYSMSWDGRASTRSITGQLG